MVDPLTKGCSRQTFTSKNSVVVCEPMLLFSLLSGGSYNHKINTDGAYEFKKTLKKDVSTGNERNHT
ncbi:hypothetical protein C5167_007135 [Papaver somniferum]|uniref:Uncharacterized protein n=1 Tax=Papaver somniferum TaxID=3469 RepID=A0A4Y7JIS6_PAPSO|nr:hypothetical protein C5167_007135 [Papaver somniferum]